MHMQPIPAELGPQFSYVEARRLGVTRHRLNAPDLGAPFRGSRIRGRESDSDDPFARRLHDLHELCRAYTVVAPPVAAFSHVTAARLYRVPLPDRLELRLAIDVAVPVGAQPPRRAGVISHRLTTARTRQLGDLTVVHPELVWVQLAPLLSLDELIVAGDYLVRRKRPASSLARLRQALEANAGCRGNRLARGAFGEIRPGTDSPPESWMRLAITRAGLPEPAVRYTVYDADGYFVGTPDLAYIEQKIAIEYEGRHHGLDENVFDDDIARRELFRRAGWLVIQFTRSHLKRPALVAARVAEALAERAPRP